jgi:hypothetical protein
MIVMKLKDKFGKIAISDNFFHLTKNLIITVKSLYTFYILNL